MSEIEDLRRSVENIEKKFLEVEGEGGKLMQCPSSGAACMQIWDIASKQTNVLLKGLGVVESAISNSFNPNSPKAVTIASTSHSLPSSISPRRSWQSTFQRLRNGETPKNRGNSMLKAGEWCPTPFFQGSEGRVHKESIKLRFGGPNGIEACFRLLFEGFVGGRVRV